MFDFDTNHRTPQFSVEIVTQDKKRKTSQPLLLIG